MKQKRQMKKEMEATKAFDKILADARAKVEAKRKGDNERTTENMG